MWEVTLRDWVDQPDRSVHHGERVGPGALIVCRILPLPVKIHGTAVKHPTAKTSACSSIQFATQRRVKKPLHVQLKSQVVNNPCAKLVASADFQSIIDHSWSLAMDPIVWLKVVL